MSDDPKLISCRQAARLGIERVRMPRWANPLDHLKLDIIKWELGPWLHLFAPFNQESNGRDPVDILWCLPAPSFADVEAKEFLPYDGPLPDSNEYRAAVSGYTGALA